MPQRYQRKRTKGFRLPDGVVVVTRPTKWGNPFKTAEDFEAVLDDIVSGRLLIDNYISATSFDIAEIYLFLGPYKHMMRIASTLKELRGKELACFCPLDKPCHADVLIKYANR